MANTRRARDPLWVDLALAVFVMALGLTSRIDVNAEALGYTRAPDALNTAIIVLQALPLALRRRYPKSVLAVVVGAWGLDRALDYPSTLASAGLILAVHAIGSELPPRASLRIGVGLVAIATSFTVLGTFTLDSVEWPSIIVTFVATAAPLALGREVHQRRRRIQELERRAARAEEEREERARKAVESERARIARELHDVVAHQMAVMTVQAEGARRLARDADPRIVEALDVIREAGHDAMTEMRRMVGLLRMDDASTGARLTPQPGLDRIDDLTRQIREAGLPVEVTVDGNRRALAPGVDVSAFRIVQESLTNALKHAGDGATAHVSLHYGPETLTIEIIDDGRGAAAGLAPDTNGHGLVGMRERVALVDGGFEAGPRPGGGFRVKAELPVHA